VWTFAQLASWSPEEIAWVDDYLGLSGRIVRDGWVAEADSLAKGLKAAS
jgi:NADH-quinone oxidoreductase subunit E